MTPEPLYYQTCVHLGGHQTMAVESYDSLHDRWREAMMKVGGDDTQAPEPIEITISALKPHTDYGDGEHVPVRASVSPLAIALIYEMPEPIEVQEGAE